jgi:hypothetical protein
MHTITLITIETNQIGDKGAIACAEGLKVNTTIVTFYIRIYNIYARLYNAIDSNNKIGDNGAYASAEMLKVNKTLTTFYIICIFLFYESTFSNQIVASNSISPSGNKALQDAKAVHGPLDLQ